MGLAQGGPNSPVGGERVLKGLFDVHPLMTDTSGTFDVALCQYELRGAASIDELLDRTADLLERAGRADVYVLPELFVTDLVADPSAEVEATALDPRQRDRLHGFLADEAAARDAVVVGGSYNVDAGDGIVNRCPVGRPDGDIETYDKCHPTPNERADGKRGGRTDPPVIDHGGLGVGVLICYDIEFPETVRGLVDRGAELLVVPSWTGTEAGHQRVRRCAAARAVENQAYVAYVPLVGDHLGEDWRATGRSAVFAPCDDVVGPHGTRLSLPQDVGAAASCSLDLGALRASRESAAVRPYTDYRETRWNHPAA